MRKCLQTASFKSWSTHTVTIHLTSGPPSCFQGPPCCLVCALLLLLWKKVLEGTLLRLQESECLGVSPGLPQPVAVDANPKAQHSCSELEQPRRDLHSSVPWRAEASTSLKSSAGLAFLPSLPSLLYPLQPPARSTSIIYLHKNLT